MCRAVRFFAAQGAARAAFCRKAKRSGGGEAAALPLSAKLKAVRVPRPYGEQKG